MVVKQNGSNRRKSVSKSESCPQESVYYNVLIALGKMRASFVGVWIFWKFYPVPGIPKSQSESPRCRFLWKMWKLHLVPMVREGAEQTGLEAAAYR